MIRRAWVLLPLIWSCSSTVEGSPDAAAVVAFGDAAPSADASSVRADAAEMRDDAAEPIPDGGIDVTRDPACPPTAAWVVILNGILRDQAGAALPNAKAQMCIRTAVRDMFFCINPADTRADGTFTIEVPPTVRCMRSAAMRFLAPRTPRGATYCKIDLATVDGTITVPDPYALFDTRPPRTLPPEGNIDAQRTVVFDDGLELDITPSKFFAEYTQLTGSRVPLNHAGLCFLEGQAPFDGLYTFAPEADIDGRAALRVPNTTMLAAGKTVHVFVLGSLGCMLDDMSLVPEAEWVEVGTGQVSMDATTIEIPSGLPCLSWFAYRADP